MEAIQAAEARAEIHPVTERELDPDDEMERPEDKEELYIDVLYTIANTVGAQVGQVSEHNIPSASFN
jgi:BAI1-associated protein 3